MQQTTPEARSTTTMSGRTWDRYLETWEHEHNADGSLRWPGDEWGDESSWNELFGNLFVPAGVADWEHVVEIGPGSGKYTDLVLRAGSAQVHGFDVSAEFMAVCEQRCRSWIEQHRLRLHLIEGQQPAEMLDTMTAAGLRRRLDAMFSIDAMVHVDLQYLVVYFMTAALLLRPGGKLIVTLSNVTSDEGFLKLLNDVSWTYGQQADPHGSGKFEWLSPDIVELVLGRLGFSVDLPAGEGRDTWLTATLVDTSLENELERLLRATPNPLD
jgi:SAM-dependent methyltransferase